MALNPSNSSNLEQLALKGLTLICQKIKTSRDLDHAHLGQFVITKPVEKPPYPAVVKQRASHLYLGGGELQLSIAGTGYTFCHWTGPVFIDAIQFCLLPSSLAVNNPFCILFLVNQSNNNISLACQAFSSFHSPFDYFL